MQGFFTSNPGKSVRPERWDEEFFKKNNSFKNCEKSFYSSDSRAGKPATDWASC